MKRCVVIFVSVIAIFVLASCSSFVDRSSDYGGGERVNAEKISEIAASIKEQISNEESASIEEASQALEEYTGVVYWTDAGGVIHKKADCSYLKKSDEIESGYVDDAIEEGKERFCSHCGK